MSQATKIQCYHFHISFLPPNPSTPYRTYCTTQYILSQVQIHAKV